MTMTLYDGSAGLFDVQGKLFAAIAALNTARETTIPDAVSAAMAQFAEIADADTPDWVPIVSGLPSSLSSWQSNGSLASQLATVARDLLIQFAADDTPQPNAAFLTVINYLLDQMIEDGDYVTGNTVSATLTPGGSNVGDPAILYSVVRGDGLTEENALAETITVTVTAGGKNPTIQFVSPAAQSTRLASDWPAGSGLGTLITATNPASSLLTNGNFELTNYDDDIPDGWIVVVGVPGTTVTVTDPEVQTIVIAGTPTGGSYLLEWTDPAGVNWSTGTILWNATASSVQAALRTIPGLSAVTVASTGTSPDYTHTITFAGVAGNIAQLTAVSHLTGGTPTITPGTTTPGDAGSYKGRALEFLCNGSELTEVNHPIYGLLPDTVYFCHFRLRAQGTAIAVGEIVADIAASVDGATLDDSAGNANSLTITAADISTSSFDSEWFSFRTPQTVGQPVYLRLRISVAVTSGARVYFDECVVVRGQQLYAGGPWIAAVGGFTPSIIDDTWDLVVANNRSGKVQEWYNRAFGMADLGLLLPVAGSSLIPESVLS